MTNLENLKSKIYIASLLITLTGNNASPTY